MGQSSFTLRFSQAQDFWFGVIDKKNIEIEKGKEEVKGKGKGKK